MSASAQALSYSAVKLFSKNSKLFEHGTGTWNASQTDRCYCGNTALCIASHVEKKSLYHEFEFMICRPTYHVCGLNSKRLSIVHTHVASIYSCSVTSLGSKENQCFYELHLTPPIFYPILRVFPLHQTAPVGVSESRDPKLFGSEIIFEVFQPVWKSRRRTDGMQSHNRALRSIAR